jgi:hypothetical protein
MNVIPPPNVRTLTVEIVAMFEAPLGRFVMATAQLDLELNFLIFETHKIVAERQLAKKPPRMLGDKIKLMIKLFQQEDQRLAAVSEVALHYLQEAHQLNELRSLVVHGALSGYVPGELPALYFLKADYSSAQKSYQHQARVVGIQELVDGGLSVTLAAKALNDIVRSMRDERLRISI